jgi:hydroxypyruvate isomerase
MCTGGQPRRGELAIVRKSLARPLCALLELGYRGYVGQEFIPVRDRLSGLRKPYPCAMLLKLPME